MHHHTDIEQNVSSVEYDLDDEDEAWLNRLAKEKGVTISCDDFEYLIDFLEKQEYLYPMIKLNMDRAVQEVRPQLKEKLKLVHDYWRARVQRDKHPLLRRFLNHAEEVDPYRAFVIKSPTFQNQQLPKKKSLEDERVVRRLEYVRAQFIQMRLVLGKTLQREELKRERARLAQHTLELLVRSKMEPKLSATLPALPPYAALPSLSTPRLHVASLEASSLLAASLANGLTLANGSSQNGFSPSSTSAPISTIHSGTSSPAVPSASTTPTPGMNPVTASPNSKAHRKSIILKTPAASRPGGSPSAPVASASTPSSVATSSLPHRNGTSTNVSHSVTGGKQPIGASSASPSSASSSQENPASALGAASNATQPSNVATPSSNGNTEEPTEEDLPAGSTQLEGEYSLNPDNLLRAYPSTGGLKKLSKEEKAKQAAAQKRLKRPQNPFISASASPFFDRISGARHDSYMIDDNETLAIEELEADCDDDDDDELIKMVENQISALSSTAGSVPIDYSASSSSQSSVDGASSTSSYSTTSQEIDSFSSSGSDDTIPFILHNSSQNTIFTSGPTRSYYPTDTLMKWSQHDVAYLQAVNDESFNSPYHPPQFTSYIPTAVPSIDPSLSAIMGGTSPTYRPILPAKKSLYQMPVVEPMLLTDPHSGYHVYYPRPVVNGSLPPRRFQVKTNITPSTVNGLHFSLWASGTDVPIGPFGHLPDDAHTPKIGLDSTLRTQRSAQNALQRIGQLSASQPRVPLQPSSILEDDREMDPPAPKRFKFANAELGYDNYTAEEVSCRLPETLYHTAEASSMSLVDLDRPGIPVFRGRKRIDRVGRVVWDRYPLEAPSTSNVNVSSTPVRPSPVDVLVPQPQEVYSTQSLLHLPQSSQPDLQQHVPSPHVHQLRLQIEQEAAATSSSPNGNGHHQYYSSENGATTAATTSPEPSSTEALSGETTIAMDTDSHSPDDSSQNLLQHSPTFKAFAFQSVTDDTHSEHSPVHIAYPGTHSLDIPHNAQMVVTNE